LLESRKLLFVDFEVETDVSYAWNLGYEEDLYDYRAIPADRIVQLTVFSKGGVEGENGYFRRNHLVPLPKVGSWEELNREHLLPLAAETFQLASIHFPTVNGSRCARVLTNFYSVPAPVGCVVQAKVYAAEVELWHEGRCVARHDRCFSRQKTDADFACAPRDRHLALRHDVDRVGGHRGRSGLRMPCRWDCGARLTRARQPIHRPGPRSLKRGVTKTLLPASRCEAESKGVMELKWCDKNYSFWHIQP